MEERRTHSSASEVTRGKGARSEPERAPKRRSLGGLTPPDTPVLQGVCRRDPEALQTFFDHYFQRVYGLVLRLLADREAAEDVTQDVFFRVHRSADRLDPNRDPGPWLTAIACNCCRKYWKSRYFQLRKRSRSADDENFLESQMPTSEDDPAKNLEAGAAAQAVRTAVSRLPEPLREAIVLHAFEGMGHEEIAESTGISHAAARKRYSRALAELKKAVGRLMGSQNE